jgi:hypothetical protein
MYYRKSMAENTKGGVKYESVLAEVQQVAEKYQAYSFDASVFEDGTDPFASTIKAETVYESTENVDDY